LITKFSPRDWCSISQLCSLHCKLTKNELNGSNVLYSYLQPACTLKVVTYNSYKTYNFSVWSTVMAILVTSKAFFPSHDIWCSTLLDRANQIVSKNISITNEIVIHTIWRSYLPVWTFCPNGICYRWGGSFPQCDHDHCFLARLSHCPTQREIIANVARQRDGKLVDSRKSSLNGPRTGIEDSVANYQGRGNRYWGKLYLPCRVRQRREHDPGKA
jgi:hypothetical protein